VLWFSDLLDAPAIDWASGHAPSERRHPKAGAFLFTGHGHAKRQNRR